MRACAAPKNRDEEAKARERSADRYEALRAFEAAKRAERAAS
ncbi:hypothetical protein [Microbacterium sp. CH-015]